MTTEPKWTHNGWCLFCPIKLAEPDSSAPCVAARWIVLEPLLSVASVVQGLIILLCSLVFFDYEPRFYFRVTGERK